MVGGDPSSCARTDARKIDRDVQMRYDIAKNEEGPLRRTVGKTFSDGDGKRKSKMKEEHNSLNVEEKDISAERYPGLDERLVNAETHLAVRYGGSDFSYLFFCVAQLHFSTISSAFFARPTTLPRSAHYVFRERVSTMGSATLQSAASWSTS